MEKQDEFFEEGLAEILSSNCVSPAEKQSSEIVNYPVSKKTHTQQKEVSPFYDTIIRILAAVIAISLLISFSTNITLK